jgi:glycosyltransferase involved in cell wall biosynthesis
VRVLLIEPYFAGSHAAWADGYRRFSRHDVIVVSHEARFWKWRMHGGFLTLAEETERVVAEHGAPDLVLASDMVNLPAYLGAIRRVIGDIPVVLYMHENQLTYPPNPRDTPDFSYGVMNWASMAVADRVVFNSAFHRDDLLAALPGFLKQFPDYRHLHLVAGVVTRSDVLAVGIDLARLDGEQPDDDGPPLILWNQRWDHDKAPEEFFAAIADLEEGGVDFLLAIAGENFRNVPEEFEAARRHFGSRIVHFGLAPESEYIALLRRASVVASAAHHEFFGIAVIEAIYAGAFPVLPNRLVYPERIPAEHQERCLYDDRPGFVARLRWAIEHPADAAAIAASLRPAMARFDWSVMAPEYDRLLAAAARGR